MRATRLRGLRWMRAIMTTLAATIRKTSTIKKRETILPLPDLSTLLVASATGRVIIIVRGWGGHKPELAALGENRQRPEGQFSPAHAGRNCADHRAQIFQRKHLALTGPRGLRRL